MMNQNGKRHVQVVTSSGSQANHHLSAATASHASCLEKLALPMTRTFVLRVMFVVSISLAIIICSLVSYQKIQALEIKIGIQTYESVAASALHMAQAITVRKFHGARVMESVLSFAFPDASLWPLVALDGYYHIAGEVASLATSGPMGLAVFVTPGEEAKALEAHAQEHFIHQGYPADTGRSDFGFGIWRTGPDSPYEDGRLPSITGNITSYQSNHGQGFLAPLVDHTMWGTKALMYDIHATDTAVDAMVKCSEDSLKRTPFLETFPPSSHNAPKKPSCSVSTGLKKLISRTDLATLIDYPIYPAHDPTTLVGFIGTSIQWIDVLTNLLPDYMDSVFAVISADTELHSNTGFNTATFEIRHGKPFFLGAGDQHDRAYDEYARSIILNDVETQATTSVVYQLTFYPASFDQFQTKSPLAVSLGFVAVVLASMCIFFLYDYLMRRQSDEQALVLDMKRRFVRYISHEIRTPLNTVCMGLELLESELQSPHSGTVAEANQNQAGNSSGADISYWRDITHDIQENAASAVTILNELLKYDKIETGNLELEIGQVLMWDLVAKVSDQFKLQALNRDITMTLVIQTDDTEPDLESGESTVSSALRALVVAGDDMRLREVIRNLLSNALKFTPTGGKVDILVSHVPNGLPDKKRRHPKQSNGRSIDSASSITSLASSFSFPRAGSILIAVTDSGVGMTKHQLSTVFNEGVQFNANRLQAGGGSGLGLCISKGIIERHHGSVAVNSPGEGLGCSFMVELPLFDSSNGRSQQGHDRAESLASGISQSLQMTEQSLHIPGCQATPLEDNRIDQQAQSVASTVSPACLKTGAPGKLVSAKHHFLVVDDVKSNRKMLCRLLERAGHTCQAACDGQEAIDIVMANCEAVSAATASANTPSSSSSSSSSDSGDEVKRIDCLLMDFEMPVLNGPDATAKLRQLGYTGTILGVTGNVLKEDVKYFKDKGADGVLPKPISIALLNEYWTGEAAAQHESKKCGSKEPAPIPATETDTMANSSTTGGLVRVDSLSSVAALAA